MVEKMNSNGRAVKAHFARASARARGGRVMRPGLTLVRAAWLRASGQVHCPVIAEFIDACLREELPGANGRTRAAIFAEVERLRAEGVAASSLGLQRRRAMVFADAALRRFAPRALDGFDERAASKLHGLRALDRCTARAVAVDLRALPDLTTAEELGRAYETTSAPGATTCDALNYALVSAGYASGAMPAEGTEEGDAGVSFALAALCAGRAMREARAWEDGLAALRETYALREPEGAP